ncbi:hypothetical protein [Agrobacterium vitis]|uniref:Uncharacterized protein n=1 Tax=Agrobacterium vitis TaxID=373 RepID=A0AAE2URM0_AGRVI|nr:hypothetical protein [Agrobacterium vitis]MBF2717257.1 hypothetical protein [Agrobacterium vitis]
MMVHPLSLDLRMRIAAALSDGMTVRVAAVRFGGHCKLIALNATSGHEELVHAA